MTDIASLGLNIDVSQVDKLARSTDNATNHIHLMNVKLTEVIRQLENLNNVVGQSSGNIHQVNTGYTRMGSTLSHLATTIYRVGQSWHYAGGPMSNAIAVATNLTSTVLNLIPVLAKAGIGALSFAGGMGAIGVGLTTFVGLSVAAGIAVAGFVKAIMAGRIETVAFSDASLRLARELAVVTKTNEQASQVWGKLYQVSYDTRTSMDTTIESFTRLTRSTENLGVSQQQVIGITSLLNKALAIGGPTAQEMRSGLTQLSQSLAKGKVDGDEFRSLMENFPYIMRRVAAGVGEAGVSLGVLKEMSSSGKLTAELFLNALIKGSTVIESDYKKMSITVEEASIRVRNAMTNLFKPAIGDQGRFISEFPEVIKMLNEVTRLIESGIGQTMKGIFVDTLNWLGKVSAGFIGMLTDMERYGVKVGNLQLMRGAIHSSDYKPSQTLAFKEMEKHEIEAAIEQQRTYLEAQRKNYERSGTPIFGKKAPFETKYSDAVAELKQLETNLEKVTDEINKTSQAFAAIKVNTFIQNIDSAKKSVAELATELKVTISDLQLIGSGVGLAGISEMESRVKALKQLRGMAGFQGMGVMSYEEEAELNRRRTDYEKTKEIYGEGADEFPNVQFKKDYMLDYTQMLKEQKKGIPASLLDQLMLDEKKMSDAEKANKFTKEALDGLAKNMATIHGLQNQVDVDAKKTSLAEYVTAHVTAAGKAFDELQKRSGVPDSAFSDAQKKNIASARQGELDKEALRARLAWESANRPEENKSIRDRAAIEAYLTQAISERTEAQLRLQNVQKMDSIDAERANRLLSDKMGFERTLETQLRKRMGFTEQQINQAKQIAEDQAKALDAERHLLQINQKLEGMRDDLTLDNAALAREKELAATGAYVYESDAYIAAKTRELEILANEARMLQEIDRLRPSPEERAKLVSKVGEITEYEREAARLKQMVSDQQAVRSFNEQIASSLASSFADVATGAKSAKEAIEDLARSTLQFLIELTARQGILMMLGALTTDKTSPNGLSSGGNLISTLMQFGLAGLGTYFGGGTTNPTSVGDPNIQGGLQHRANGMVFDSPSMVRSRGQTSVVGEAGPEGLFPLVRDSGGKLAIRAAGGGSRTINAPISITQNVSYGSANQDQSPVHARKIADDLRRELQGVVREVLLDEQRPGGAFG